MGIAEVNDPDKLSYILREDLIKFLAKPLKSRIESIIDYMKGKKNVFLMKEEKHNYDTSTFTMNRGLNYNEKLFVKIDPIEIENYLYFCFQNLDYFIVSQVISRENLQTDSWVNLRNLQTNPQTVTLKFLNKEKYGCNPIQHYAKSDEVKTRGRRSEKKAAIEHCTGNLQNNIIMMEKSGIKCKELNQSFLKNLSKFVNDLRKIASNKITTNTSPRMNNVCEFCFAKNTINSIDMEVICCGCGGILNNKVFVSDEDYQPTAQKVKHETNENIRHCKAWFDQILGRTNTTIPDEVIDMIKGYMRNDRITSDKLNCKIIRRYLKKGKKTSYNDDATLILKKCDGPPPPTPAHDEEDEMVHRFIEFMELYSKIKPQNKPNRPHYPYFILRDIEIQYMIHPGDIMSVRRYKNKMLGIINYIHIQTENTIRNNDKFFKEMCESSEGRFKYKPLDPYKYAVGNL